MRTPLLALLVALVAAVLFISPSPRPAFADGVVDIVAGSNHACALMADGGVKCWGYNLFAQIGDGTIGDFARTTPVDVCEVYDEASATCAQHLTGVVAIAAGGNHTCALVDGGRLKCWGDNLVGQLGVGEAEECPNLFGGVFPCARTPVEVAELPPGVVAVDAGREHTCAVIEDGRAYCWGPNRTGELGDGTTNWASTPVQVSSPETIEEVALGRKHTCALTADAAVLCWGDGSSGRLGSIPTESCPGFWVGDPTPCSTIPRPVCEEHGEGEEICEQRLEGAASVSAGGSNTCVVTEQGDAKCWGTAVDGALGAETEEQCDSGAPLHSLAPCSSTPLEVGGLSGAVTALDAGSLRHSCAVTVAGGLKCWGDNARGRLGDGTEEDRSAPVDVLERGSARPLSGVADVAAGRFFTCALMTSSLVKCWGSNCCGELGNGEQDFEAHPYPADVSGLEPKRTPIPTMTPQVLLGDVNCDDAVTSVDAALILQLEAGLVVSLLCPVNGDTSGDGSIDSIDAVLILQSVAGLKDWG